MRSDANAFGARSPRTAGPDVLIGIDIGTTSVKAIAYEAEPSLTPLARAARATPTVAPHVGHSEIDPMALWATVSETVREVRHATSTRGVRAISLSGVACGAFLVDSEGAPTRPAILWNDARAAASISDWMADGRLDQIFRVSGNVVFPGYTLPLLGWLLEHEPQSIERSSAVLCAKDWIRLCMTGAVATDPSDASYMPWDIQASRYSDQLAAWTGALEASALLPPVRPSTSIAGTLVQSAADAMGVPHGTLVITGMVDVVASTVGAGVVAEGQACTVFGTSCINSRVVAEPVTAPLNVGITASFGPGAWLRSLVNTAGTTNVEWLRARFWNDAPFDAIEDAVEAVPIGSGGVLYHPYLSHGGVVSPFVHPHARALFSGLTGDADRAALSRAVFEGLAMAIAEAYRAIPGTTKQIVLVGGGARSRVWPRMIADITGATVVVPSFTETGTRGAAIAAGVGVGVFESVGEGPEPDPAVREYWPDSAAHERYREVALKYEAVHRAMRPVWDLDRREIH